MEGETTGLWAGMRTIPVPPSLGVDMVGFLRRHEPAREYGQPMEVNALVVDDGERRAVIVALDLIATPGEYGLAMRDAIAVAAGCPREAVFVNCQHTHAAPPPPGLIKMGGLDHERSAQERGYWDQLIRAAASVVAAAAGRLQPARMGTGSGSVDGLSVNRRERLPDGTTILGWNREAACDRTVSVLRFETSGGAPIGTVVGFACHPVVVGPDVPELSSDFVGPMREAVRAFTGADCMFLQGCAGNILPLECFLDAPGPEFEFGRRLALAALAAWTEADVIPRHLERSEYRSAVPIARYRWVPEGGEFDYRVDFAERWIEIPLDTPPSVEEMASLRRELEERVRALQAAGAGPEQWNPVELHALWAVRAEERLRAGTAERSVRAPVQVLRIGRVGVVGLPGEPFNEIGTRIKEASPAAFTVCCGYSNDAVGYLPTSEEHDYGGYEVALNHRHYGHVAPIAKGCDRVLQEAAADLLGRLFDGSGVSPRSETNRASNALT